MTTSPQSTPAAPADAAEPGGPPSTEPRDEQVRWEQAVAFGIEGFDPADPWNAALCVEGEGTGTVLPLTPRHLDYLTAQLEEVRHAQRAALGVPEAAEGRDDGATVEPRTEEGDHDESDERDDPDDRTSLSRRLAHVARIATGSQHVAALWNGSPGGRLGIIAVTLVFVGLGIVLSFVT